MRRRRPCARSSLGQTMTEAARTKKPVIVTDDILKHLTRRLWLGLVLYNLPILLALGVYKPQWVYYYAVGCGLAVAFGASLLWCVRLGSMPLVLASTFGRLITIPLLSGWLGHFEFAPTLLVFAGCLSYKWVVLIELFRYRMRYR